MTLSFLADEHVRASFVTELRANGYDVSWVESGYDQGRADEDHLETARAEGRVVLTNDTDFARLHDEYEHAGVVVYSEQTMSVSDFIRGVKRIDRFLSPDELADRLLWLVDWTD